MWQFFKVKLNILNQTENKINGINAFYENVKPLFYSKAVEVRFVLKPGW